jgi:hypothetical protein
MKRSLLALLGLVGFGVLPGSTCTSTFNEADLTAEERKRDAAAVAEEKRDREIGEQGGANEQAIDEQIEDVDGGSGADF